MKLIKRKYASFSNLLWLPTLRLKYLPQHPVVQCRQSMFPFMWQTNFHVHSYLYNGSSVFVFVREFDYFRKLKDFRNTQGYDCIVPDLSLKMLDTMVEYFKVMANTIQFSVCSAVESKVKTWPAVVVEWRWCFRMCKRSLSYFVAQWCGPRRFDTQDESVQCNYYSSCGENAIFPPMAQQPLGGLGLLVFRGFTITI